jgi:hypothetical protein
MEVARDPDRALNRVRRLVISGLPIGRKSDPSRHASGEKWIAACRSCAVCSYEDRRTAPFHRRPCAVHSDVREC